MRCCAATRSRPSCAGATRRACIDRRAGRGRRPASSSARNGLPGWSAAAAVADGARLAGRRVGAHRRRLPRGRSGRAIAPAIGRGRPAAGARRAAGRVASRRRAGPYRPAARRRCRASASTQRGSGDAPFVAGEIADRGPARARGGVDRARDARARGPRARAAEGVARPGIAGAPVVQGRGGDCPGQRRRPRGGRR